MGSFRIKGKQRLKAYYRRREVVGGYLRERFESPLGRFQNRNQIRFLKGCILKYKPTSVLELACGPARVTTHIGSKGIALDSSPEMLKEAKRKLEGRGRWDLVRGDVFFLPFKEGVLPMVFTLRFIRHFNLKERKEVFSEIRRVLSPRGLFIFDAPNYLTEYPIRLKQGLDRYPIYDHLWKEEELVGEMAQNGFLVVEMWGNIHHYRVQAILSKLNLGPLSSALIRMAEFFKRSEPLEWLALCQKG